MLKVIPGLMAWSAIDNNETENGLRSVDDLVGRIGFVSSARLRGRSTAAFDVQFGVFGSTHHFGRLGLRVRLSAGKTGREGQVTTESLLAGCLALRTILQSIRGLS